MLRHLYLDHVPRMEFYVGKYEIESFKREGIVDLQDNFDLQEFKKEVCIGYRKHHNL